MKYSNITILTLALSATMVSCNDFLDQEPPSQLVPETFYTTESQAQAAANQFYADVLPSGDDMYSNDNNTDVQTGRTPDNRFDDKRWLTDQNNGNWNWGNVRNLNFMINRLETNFANKTLTGSERNIKQYIGELYFFRAYEYYKMMLKFGDLPIVKEPLPDDEATLVAANHREPCNEVARFILSDLDKAIGDMADNFDANHTRVSRDVALLFKSRVALYMGSWLTNFAGTPFVPNGEGWPGAKSNAGYKFPTGSIDAEAKWFFEQSADAAQQVAEKYKNQLSINNGKIPNQVAGQADDNPYFDIWGTENCSGKPEVLLWRQYSRALNVTNNIEVAAEYSGYGGYTRSMVEGFLMADGLPRYASKYTYSDQTIADVAKNRDPRLYIFLKKPGDINCVKNVDGDHANPVEGRPDMTTFKWEGAYITGYTIRKGMTFDGANCRGRGMGQNAVVVFRATEALLNYVESEYMLTKNLHAGHILEYWRKVRQAAGFTSEGQDPEATINATDMSKEKSDWGAWTAGKLLTDKTLYNIRRERRCEFLSERLRDFDLKRWRSFDQLIEHPVHIEGFHVWNTPMAAWYTGKNFVTDGGVNANMSSPSLSEYFRPHEINMVNNDFADGLTWRMAHYLDPLPLKQFLLTSPDHASVDQSTLYQNPYWPTKSGLPATK